MQTTDITAHDADQKQGNAMNSNLNRGSSRKEKQVNAITRATSVAVLVTLGLALAARAAEPLKPETPADLDKLIGLPVDLAPWAYVWRRIARCRRSRRRISSLGAWSGLIRSIAHLNRD